MRLTTPTYKINQVECSAAGQRPSRDAGAVSPETPQTVTHVFGVTSCKQPLHVRLVGAIAGSLSQAHMMGNGKAHGVWTLASPPMRRSNRDDVHTRSHVKVGSVPSSGLQ